MFRFLLEESRAGKLLFLRPVLAQKPCHTRGPHALFALCGQMGLSDSKHWTSKLADRCCQHAFRVGFCRFACAGL